MTSSLKQSGAPFGVKKRIPTKSMIGIPKKAAACRPPVNTSEAPYDRLWEAIPAERSERRDDAWNNIILVSWLQEAIPAERSERRDDV